jgi:two-component system response regulator HydG
MDITLPDDNLHALLANPLVVGLLDQINDGAVVIDIASRKVLAMNRQARQLLALSEDEVGGSLCRDALNSPLCKSACLLTESLRSDGRADPACATRDAEVFYRGRDGASLLHARARMVVVRNPAGEPIAGIEMFSDLTETRRLERALGDRRSLHGIIGNAPPMQKLYALLEQVAPYDLPVLITGESGVGKERVADAVVGLSDRARKPYVKVNCAALNPSLVESELFGHRRGAFTGAVSDRRGSFEEAHGGTLLLDELGELPLSLQAKLLRVIQQGELQRVGEDRPRTVDVRVIAATNRDIEADVHNGHFREDLYYRLAGVRLHVPPLRERKGDLPLLATHFLGRFRDEARQRGRPKAAPGLRHDALAELAARDWRGNVRELENVLRLAFIRVPDGAEIAPEHLMAPTGRVSVEPEPVSLQELEKRAIQRAMDQAEGNMAAAARLLGVDRTTLWRKLRRGES